MISESKRILYLDLLRAFAVLMMVQGHTIDSLLSIDFRTYDSLIYSIWHSLRGFTAPIFMFTSGVVFTFLLRKSEFNNNQKFRIRKGIKRGLVLILTGYLLRYPTATIFDFSKVSDSQWSIFYTVDALHLIGVGLLLIILVYKISEILNINIYFSLSLLSMIFLFGTPIIRTIDLNSYLHVSVLAYFTSKYGSFFPLFPWVSYMFLGAILGSIIGMKKDLYLKRRFAFSLTGVSILLILSSFIFEKFIGNFYNYNFNSVSIFIYRIGVVVLLNAIISFSSIYIKKIPDIISLIGKHTLPIYIIHLIIIYGCAWTPGLYKYFQKSFNTEEALLSALMMILLMLAIISSYEKAKDFNWKKLIRFG